MIYHAPAINLKSFTCPHCGVLARQYKWGFGLNKDDRHSFNEDNLANASLRLSQCENCRKNCIWVGDAFIFPDRGATPQPNSDMPAEVRADYEEAARIFTKSPRGAAALLRLALQKLMISLGQPGRNINDDIAALVAAGLPAQVRQALDVVRVTGNNAVHPGMLDANDVNVAQQLFPLLNVVVEYQLSLPARVREMYDALPEGARSAIERRDAPR
jgi:hypothetical protein